MQNQMIISDTIVAELCRLSELLYGSETAFGPTVSQWNKYRHPDLPSGRAVMGISLGISPDSGRAADWTVLLETCRLAYPPRPIAQDADQRLQESGRMPYLLPRMDDHDGLTVRLTKIISRAWCPRRHAWLESRTIQAYMVI